MSIEWKVVGDGGYAVSLDERWDKPNVDYAADIASISADRRYVHGKIEELTIGGFITPRNSLAISNFIRRMKLKTLKIVSNGSGSLQVLWNPKDVFEGMRGWSERLAVIDDPAPHHTRKLFELLHGRPIYPSDAKRREAKEATRLNRLERSRSLTDSKEFPIPRGPPFVMIKRTCEGMADAFDNSRIADKEKKKIPKTIQAITKRVVANMPASITGIDPSTDRILRGCVDSTEGVVLGYSGPIIPPSCVALSQLQYVPTQYEEFLKKLSPLRRFANAALSKRDERLWSAVHGGRKQLFQFQFGEARAEMARVIDQIASNASAEKPWNEGLDPTSSKVIGYDRRSKSRGLARRGSQSASSASAMSDVKQPEEDEDVEEEDQEDIYITLIDRGDAKGMFGSLPDEVIRSWENEFPTGRIPINRIVGALRNDAENESGNITAFSLDKFTVMPDTSAEVPVEYEGLEFDFESNMIDEFRAQTREDVERFLVHDSKTDPRLVVTVPKRPKTNALSNERLMISSVARALHEREEAVRPVYLAVKSWIVNAHHAQYALRQLVLLSARRVSSPVSSRVVYEGARVMACVQAVLMTKAGVYNRENKRTETGLELYCTEMSNTAMCDAYTRTPRIVSQLLAAAMLKRKVKTWYPTADLIVEWIRFGIRVQSDVVDRFRYELPMPDPNSRAKNPVAPPLQSNVISAELNDYQTVAALAEFNEPGEARIAIYRAIALTDQSEQDLVNDQDEEEGNIDHLPNYSAMEVMPWIFTVSPHWAPMMVHFLEYTSIAEKRNFDSPTAPYAVIMREIDYHLTSTAPRRERGMDLTFSTPFQKLVIRAKELYWNAAVAKRESPIPHAPDVKYEPFSNSSIHPSWIAGGIGSIPVKVEKTRLNVTLNPKKLHEFNVSRPISDAKPIKGEVESPEDREARLLITPESRAEAIEEAMDVLQREGVEWIGNTPPVPAWAKMKISRRGDEYYLGGVAWSSRLKENELMPVFPATARHWTDSFVFMESGKAADATDWLRRQIEKELPVEVLRRCLTYLEDKRTKIAFPLITRDGEGRSVLADTGVFQFFIQLCRYFPHTLSFEKDLSFRIKYAPVMFMIRASITARLKTTGPAAAASSSSSASAAAAAAEQKGGWNLSLLKDRLNRVLRDDQVDAINEMYTKYLAGFRGDLLWRDPGSGKTIICIMTVLKVIKGGRDVPTRIFHMTPKSSAQSIYNEYDAMGFKVYMIQGSPKRSEQPVWNTNKPLPEYTVFIILHDDMRQAGVTGTLTPAILGSAWGMFDEYHELMNKKTQRTQWALNYTELIAGFIALTGTAAKDANGLKALIPIMSLTNEFEVTEKNKETAVNSVTHQNIKPPAEDVDKEFFVDLTKEEEEVYNRIMTPEFGGTRSTTIVDKGGFVTAADGPTGEEKRLAKSILNDAMDRGVVSQTLKLLKEETKQPGVLVRARSIDIRNQYFKQLVAGGVKPDTIVLVGELFSASTPKDDKPLLNKAISRKSIDLPSYGDALPDVRIVIIPMHMSTGFNATRFKHSMEKPEEVNSNSNTQWRRRLNRLGQVSKQVYHWIPLDSKGRARKLLTGYQFPENINMIVSDTITSRSAVAAVRSVRPAASSDVRPSAPRPAPSLPPPPPAAAASSSSSAAAARPGRQPSQSALLIAAATDPSIRRPSSASLMSAAAAAAERREALRLALADAAKAKAASKPAPRVAAAAAVRYPVNQEDYKYAANYAPRPIVERSASSLSAAGLPSAAAPIQMARIPLSRGVSQSATAAAAPPPLHPTPVPRAPRSDVTYIEIDD